MDVFRISSQKQIQVKMLISMRACELLKEEYPLAETYIQQVDENHFLFDVPVCSYEGIGRFVLGLCNEIEIIEPREFKIFLKKKVKKSLTDIS